MNAVPSAHLPGYFSIFFRHMVFSGTIPSPHLKSQVLRVPSPPAGRSTPVWNPPLLQPSPSLPSTARRGEPGSCGLHLGPSHAICLSPEVKDGIGEQEDIPVALSIL